MKKPEATYDNTYLPKEFSVDAGIGIKYKKNKTSLWERYPMNIPVI